MNSLEFIEKEIKFLKDMINMDFALMEDGEDLEDIAKKQQHLSYLQQIKTELEEHKKLKDKETPKKPIRFKNSVYISTPKCPLCKTTPHTGNQKYCDECGQALDWSDEEVRVEDE